MNPFTNTEELRHRTTGLAVPQQTPVRKVPDVLEKQNQEWFVIETHKANLFDVFWAQDCGREITNSHPRMAILILKENDRIRNT